MLEKRQNEFKIGEGGEISTSQAEGIRKRMMKLEDPFVIPSPQRKMSKKDSMQSPDLMGSKEETKKLIEAISFANLRDKSPSQK